MEAKDDDGEGRLPRLGISPLESPWMIARVLQVLSLDLKPPKFGIEMHQNAQFGW